MKWKLSLILYSLFLLVVFIAAYLELVPTEIKLVPFYDSVGHFVFYGIWGYLFAKVFSRKINIRIFVFPLGILLIICIAVLEESLQSLSTIRAFSIFDLGWGIIGILLGWLLLGKEKISVEKHKF